MIASAVAVASAAGVGCLAAGLGCFVAVLGWPPVGLEGCFLQIGFAWLQIGQASGKAGGQFLQIGVAWLQIGQASGRAGWQLLLAISAGLIHENQPTVCKGTAFSWNKYQK